MGKNTGERAILREEKRLAKEKKRQIETANKMLIPVSKKTNQSLGIQSFEPEGTIRLQNNRWLRVFEATEDTLCQMVGASNKLNVGMRITMHMSDESGRARDIEKCIVQLRGVRPFLSNKFDLTKHPNYPLTSDYSKKNWFDVEKFLKQKLVLKADDQYEVIEVNE